MGEKQTLEVDRILGIHNGISSIGDNELLTGDTNYRLARQIDFVRNIVKSFEKAKAIAIKKCKTEGDVVADKMKVAEGSEKGELNKRLKEIADSLTNEISGLIEKKEEVTIIKFKITEFVATDDTKKVVTVKDKNGNDIEETIIIKKGRALVPVSFFVLMGDLIEEK